MINQKLFVDAIKTGNRNWITAFIRKKYITYGHWKVFNTIRNYHVIVECPMYP